MVLAIFNAIAAIPAVLGYIEKFAGWLTVQCQAARLKQLAKEAEEAARNAHDTQDPQYLDHLFDPSKPDGKKKPDGK